MVDDADDLIRWFLDAVELDSNRLVGGIGIMHGEAPLEDETRVGVDLFAQLLRLRGFGVPGAVLNHDHDILPVRILRNDVDHLRVGESRHDDHLALPACTDCLSFQDSIWVYGASDAEQP